MYIDHEKYRKLINQEEPNFLDVAKRPKANGFTSYICPFCGNGSGSGAGDGIVIDLKHSSEKRRYTCFKCTPPTGKSAKSYDVVDLYMEWAHVDMHTAIVQLCERYGIVIEEAVPMKSDRPQQQAKREQKQHLAAAVKEAQGKATKQDFTDFFLEANRNLLQTDYYRGISLDTLNKYKVGYVAQWKAPGSNGRTSPRLIIPTTKYTYSARNIDPAGENRYIHIGGNRLFNVAALKLADTPIFLTEGELDALSLLDIGQQAIALGGTSNTGIFLKAVQMHRPKHSLIIALDADNAGQQAQKDMLEALQKLDIPAITYQWQGAKDPNELLMQDKAQLKTQALEALNLAAVKKEEYAHEYLDVVTAAAHLPAFINGIAASANTQIYPTGFSNLDSILGGGLYKGVILLGAIPSLGKTTLALQMADNVAAAGGDVLIFSLEMERMELIAKSISRNTLLECMEQGCIIEKYAKSQRGITDGWRYKQYNAIDQEVINAAIKRYEQYAGRIAIIETDEITVPQIKEAVEKHISITGTRPLVIVDYIQIIAPTDPRLTDKQHLDQVARGLKRISRDCKIPLLAISSFNRDNYGKPVNFSSFKESGGLEYGADVIIGLQLQGVGSNNFDVDKAKQCNPRRIEAVILKQRSGETGKTLVFEYYPKYNYMEGKQC